MSEKRIVRAAAVKSRPTSRAAAGTLERVLDAIAEAGGQGRGAGGLSRDLRSLVSLFLVRAAAGAHRRRASAASTSTRSSCPAR